MMNGTGLDNCLIFIVLLFQLFTSSCRSNRVDEINYGVEFISKNKSIIDSIFKPFSKTNSKRDIVVIYFERELPTIIPSRFLKNELNIVEEYLFLDTINNKDLTNRLIAKFPDIKKVITYSQKIGVSSLSACNDSVSISLKGFDSFIRNFDYVERDGLRSKEKMIQLSKDDKSKYWLWQIDSNWIILNDP